jgi:hypothetical protein
LDAELLRRDPAAFCDLYGKVNERGQPFALFDYQREILRTAYTFDADGRLPWDTLLDARIKKTSKTYDNGLRLVHWGRSSAIWSSGLRRLERGWTTSGGVEGRRHGRLRFS